MNRTPLDKFISYSYTVTLRNIYFFLFQTCTSKCCKFVIPWIEVKENSYRTMIQPATKTLRKLEIIKLLTHTKSLSYTCMSYCVVKHILSVCTGRSKNLCYRSLENRSIDRTLCTDSRDSTTNGQAENMAWELMVDYDRLSPLELKIHERHKRAVRVKLNNLSFY